MEIYVYNGGAYFKTLEKGSNVFKIGKVESTLIKRF